MSTERRWAERRFILEESTTRNGGARTVFIEHMTPGTSVPPHVHTRFAETFDLIKGSMSVYQSAEPDLEKLEATEHKLEIGTKVTVEPGRYHKYVVTAGEGEETVLRAIVTPGDADFERLLMIMDGMGRDGRLESLTDSVELMAVIYGLSDATPIGPVGAMLEGVRKDKKDEIEKLRKELLAAYDNELSLKRLLGEEP